MTTPFKVGEAHRTVPYLIADLVELMLAIKYDGVTSLHQADVMAILARSDRSAEELDDPEDTPSDVEEEITLDDTWKQLKYRESRFGEAYPFIVDGDSIEILPELSNEQRVYRFLLTCSRLRSFSPQMRSSWATSFSELCAVAMKAIMPVSAVIRVFDANSNDRRSHFGTNLRNALVTLGKDLHAHYINEETCNKQSTSGDAQLDLVGIVPFNDGAAGTYAILGQCAAREKDWPSKRMEAHPVNLTSFFMLLPTPANLCFIPGCYRMSTGEWVNEAKATGCLLIDRFRIMKSLIDTDNCSAITGTAWFGRFEGELPMNVAA